MAYKSADELRLECCPKGFLYRRGRCVKAKFKPARKSCPNGYRIRTSKTKKGLRHVCVPRGKQKKIKFVCPKGYRSLGSGRCLKTTVRKKKKGCKY